MLWEGETSGEFLETLATSPAFEAPFDRKKILEHYRAADASGVPKLTLNAKGYTLMYRHAVHELCVEVGRKIRRLPSAA